MPLRRLLAAAPRDGRGALPNLGHERLHALTPTPEDLVPLDP
jgi:hypothetical protein